MSRTSASASEEPAFTELLEPCTTSSSLHDETSSYSFDSPESTRLTASQAWNLYASHLLSMWNARTYEFAVVRFLVAISLSTSSCGVFTYVRQSDHFHGCCISKHTDCECYTVSLYLLEYLLAYILYNLLLLLLLTHITC